jgi:hypothetical protein
MKSTLAALLIFGKGIPQGTGVVRAQEKVNLSLNKFVFWIGK